MLCLTYNNLDFNLYRIKNYIQIKKVPVVMNSILIITTGTFLFYTYIYILISKLKIFTYYIKNYNKN